MEIHENQRPELDDLTPDEVWDLSQELYEEGDLETAHWLAKIAADSGSGLASIYLGAAYYRDGLTGQAEPYFRTASACGLPEGMVFYAVTLCSRPPGELDELAPEILKLFAAANSKRDEMSKDFVDEMVSPMLEYIADNVTTEEWEAACKAAAEPMRSH